MIKEADYPVRAWAVDDGGALKFSGHESFVLRYGWLPKLYEAITEDADIFASDERAILHLGLGKNMVKSIRFWGEAFGVSGSSGRQVVATPFGRRMLDPGKGSDPFLETKGSLWRLHWNAVTRGRLGAWSVMFQELQDPEATRERLVGMVGAAAARLRGPVSVNTAGAHVDMLIKTYTPNTDTMETVPEDALGCPLQELDLLRAADHLGTPTIRLVRGRKETLDGASFAFALHDFWLSTSPNSRSISARALLLSRRSPGRVFALDEASLHERLAAVCEEVTHLEMREDGAGGVDVVMKRDGALDRLEEAAW